MKRSDSSLPIFVVLLQRCLSMPCVVAFDENEGYWWKYRLHFELSLLLDTARFDPGSAKNPSHCISLVIFHSLLNICRKTGGSSNGINFLKLQGIMRVDDLGTYNIISRLMTSIFARYRQLYHSVHRYDHEGKDTQ